MFSIFSLAISVGAAWFGFFSTRRFVRERLRYVDGAQSAGAAVIAGLAAMLLTWPLAAMLPLVTGGTVITFGFAVGLGAKVGASDIKQGYRLRGR
jgi:hypothetical protein